MYRIGIDLGGTNLKIGLIDPDYRIVDQSVCETHVQAVADGVIEKIVLQVRDIISKNNLSPKEILGVGLGCPGVINSKTGTVLYSNNFNWHDLPIRSILSQKLNLPLVVTNDAKCAALGELMAGSAIGCKNIVLLTLGTGVGSGIVVNGKLLDGSGCGGVAGHNTIVQNGRQCTCGRKGCLEAYASATALISETKKQLHMHPESLIADLCGRDPEKIDGRIAFEAAKRGDSYGQQIVDDYIEALANGVSNLVNLFRPEKILLSGGICNEGDTLLTPLNKKVKEYCFANIYLCPPPVEIARLKNTAGIIGAASLINL